MLPRIGSSKLISTWIFATLACSITAAVDGGFLSTWLSLAPARVCRGEVWRLVTWVLIESSPFALALTCISIYKFGGELAPRWGDRRLRRFMLDIILAGGVITTLCGFLSEDVWRTYRTGGWAVGDALVIAWARQYPTAVLRIYGVLELSGRQIVGYTVGFTCLIAIFYSPLYMAPELVACFGAAYYPHSRLRL